MDRKVINLNRNPIRRHPQRQRSQNKRGYQEDGEGNIIEIDQRLQRNTDREQRELKRISKQRRELLNQQKKTEKKRIIDEQYQYDRWLVENSLLKKKQQANLFQELPQELTISEIQREQAQLSQIKSTITGQFRDIKEFLTNHFHILREDYFHDIKKALYFLQKYGIYSKQFKELQNTYYLYDNVSFKKIEIKQFLTMKLELNTYGAQFRIDWKKTKRLAAGQLLILISSKLDKLANVILIDRRHDNRNNNIKIIVQPLNYQEFINLFHIISRGCAIAIESRNYYEATRYHLANLREMIWENKLNFSEYFLNSQTQPQFPKYQNSFIKNQYVIKDDKGSRQINLNQSNPFQNFDQFDKSQQMALTTFLTSNLALIQGPPGTGKTFVGIKGIKILLDNNVSKKPILISCYTDHALDQFLEKLLEQVPINQMSRLGSRTKSKKLEQTLLQ